MDYEQRQSPRKVLRTKAKLELGGGAPIILQTLDIGIGGMSISAPHQLPPGQSVHIVFDMFFHGKNHRMAVNGKVMHCVYSSTFGFKAGLKFTQLDAAASSVIEAYLKC